MWDSVNQYVYFHDVQRVDNPIPNTSNIDMKLYRADMNGIFKVKTLTKN